MVEYRKYFDFIAKINAEYSQEMAVSREKNRLLSDYGSL